MNGKTLIIILCCGLSGTVHGCVSGSRSYEARAITAPAPVAVRRVDAATAVAPIRIVTNKVLLVIPDDVYPAAQWKIYGPTNFITRSRTNGVTIVRRVTDRVQFNYTMIDGAGHESPLSPPSYYPGPNFAIINPGSGVLESSTDRKTWGLPANMIAHLSTGPEKWFSVGTTDQYFRGRGSSNRITLRGE